MGTIAQMRGKPESDDEALKAVKDAHGLVDDVPASNDQRVSGPQSTHPVQAAASLSREDGERLAKLESSVRWFRWVGGGLIASIGTLFVMAHGLRTDLTTQSGRLGVIETRLGHLETDINRRFDGVEHTMNDLRASIDSLRQLSLRIAGLPAGSTQDSAAQDAGVDANPREARNGDPNRVPSIYLTPIRLTAHDGSQGFRFRLPDGGRIDFLADPRHGPPRPTDRFQAIP